MNGGRGDGEEGGGCRVVWEGEGEEEEGGKKGKVSSLPQELGRGGGRERKTKARKEGKECACVRVCVKSGLCGSMQ